MDRVTAVLEYQWRAYWRRFRRAGNFRTNNVGILILFGGLGLIRYLQQLPVVAAQLAKGATARYEMLLVIVFLVWMLPVMGETRRSISTRDLLHLPLTCRDRFLIRLTSVFFSPVTWILVAGSLALAYPLAMAQHPLTGLIALLTFLLLALFTSLTITHLLNNAFVRKLSVVALLVLSIVIRMLWLKPRGSAGSLLWLLPNRLAASVAVSPVAFRSLAVLVGMSVLVAGLSVWTFRLTLEPRQNRRSQRFILFRSINVSGRFGGLLKKDLRYSSRLLDLYLALPIVIFFDMYLTSDTAPSAVVFAIMVGLLFLPCLSLVFNSFGLDSPLGFDRYTLLPLSSKEKLLSKNLAFATIMVALFVTMLPLTMLNWECAPVLQVLWN